MARPPIPDRPQPPVKKAASRVSYRPAFVWQEWEETVEREGKPVVVQRRSRGLPPAAAASARELEAGLREILTARGLPLPPAGEIAARVLHVAAHIPAHEQQRIIALPKETPPFWGVTTERARD